jgi:hypothetical protein
MLQKVTRETGIHYSNNPVALLAKKKESEGSESTTSHDNTALLA